MKYFITFLIVIMIQANLQDDLVIKDTLTNLVDHSTKIQHSSYLLFQQGQVPKPLSFHTPPPQVHKFGSGSTLPMLISVFILL